MKSRSLRAFTMIELLVVVGLIGVGFSVLPGPLGKARESANRVKCSSNLRQIGLAMMMYANAERGNNYPRGKYDVDAADKPVAYTKPNVENPFAEDGPGPNDVTAGLWLLLRTQEITPDVFVCPSSRAQPFNFPAGKTAVSYSNFDSQAHFSYSVQNQYPSKDAVDRGFKFNMTMSADFAMMSDMNPGGDAVTTVTAQSPASEQKKANSLNHDRDGQNVLYADGHVEWTATVFAGAQQDNIFVFNKDNTRPHVTPGGIMGSPSDDVDTILLPTFDAKAAMPGDQTP